MSSVIPSPVRDSAAARGVRDALARNDALGARDLFVSLPGVAAHHGAWLAEALDDVYSTGRVELRMAITFLAALPDAAWALAGCGVLQRARRRLEREKAPAVRLSTIPLASLVHRLCGELGPSAEAHWVEWFCPTVRAVVLGRPLVLEAKARREVLYAGSDLSSHDWDRRSVFGWRQQWTPKLVEKEQWLFVPVDDAWDRFFLESVVFSERLYVETQMALRGGALGPVKRRVFTWRNHGERLDDDDARAHWELVPAGGDGEDTRRGEFRIYNAASHAYLCSPDDVVDGERRHVCCVATGGESDASAAHLTWRVLPQRLSDMDSGVAAFYGARYEDAIALFTRVLAEYDDHARAEDAERVAALVLRAACSVRLGGNNDAEGARTDMNMLEQCGGERAARKAELHHVWQECAVALGVRPTPTKAVEAEDSVVAAVTALASQREFLARGDQLCALHFVDKALAAYQEAVEVTTRVDRADVLVLARYAEAQLRVVRCLYVLNRSEEVLAVAETLSQAIKDGDSAAAVRYSTSVELLLWRARCERKLGRYKAAAATLVEALDALVGLTTNVSTAPESAWLEQSIRTELEVVQIFEKRLVEALVQSEPTPESSDRAAEQLVHSLRCPLSFEFMHDPVLTPSGTTYERAMIERHLEAVGLWDPMTRQELRKDQLYPNRALKLLLETLLSEHKLGRLLASCEG